MSEYNDVKIFLINQMGVSENIKNDENIFSSNMLDSIDVLTIFVFLEKKYSLKINPFDLGLDDFDSIEKIVNTIKRLRKE